MIQGKWILPGSPEFDTADNIMNTVFTEEINSYNDYLHKELDSMANHVIVLDTDTKNIAGYGRVTYDLENFVIDNFCVLKEYRGNFYGDFVVRMLVDKAIQCSADAIYCSVPSHLEGFLKSIGFKVLSDTANKPQNLYIYDNYTMMCLYPADFTSRCHCH